MTDPDALKATGARPAWRRRQLVALPLLVVAAAAAGYLWRGERSLTYRPIPDLTPFRALAVDGGVSVGALAFAGLDDGTPDDGQPLADRVVAVRSDPCTALFGPESDDRLPLAYFTDVNCPNCRVLEHGLTSILARDPDLRLVRHELPVLGPASVTAARAILAAGVQGQAEALARRLSRAGLVTDAAYLRAVAGGIGLDADRLLVDMDSAAVGDRLLTAQALARMFGLAGVPALVIGRTLLTGAVPGDTIAQAIRDERVLTPHCWTPKPS